MDRFSTWETLVSALTVLIRAAKKKTRQQMTQRQLVDAATNLLIKLAQTLLDKDQLKSLDPKVGEDGILRVGGRLGMSDQTAEIKHPAILPKTGHITKLIIDYHHRLTGHPGRGITMSAIREKGYWITGLSSAVSQVIHSCVSCKKLRGKIEVQKMADLPQVRTEPAPPFTYSGMDCFGPFLVKDRRKEIKRYGLLFTCLTSRAVHIEMIDDLSTDSFLNAFRCLVAMRGDVKTLYSDQGTNFKGAQSELAKSISEITDTFHRSLATKFGCEFLFNTPSSSHMGGVWERQIQSARHALNGLRLERHAQLTSSSLRTLFYEVTGIINSRPLTVEDLNDPEIQPITPNHLLHLKSNILLPPPGDFDEVDGYSRKQWRRVQHLANIFWKKWRHGYLQSLQNRQKWISGRPGVDVGDVVIVMNDNPLRNQWRLARIVELIPSHDGRVRKVKLRLGNTELDKKGRPTKQSSELERPVAKLVVLVKG